jgi:hypothetical protein
MPNEFERPSFLKSYLESLSKSVDRRGWFAVFPYWVHACLLVGVGAAYRIPVDFWDAKAFDVSVPVYVGILTFNGLMLALSWGAFSRIYDSLGEPGFRGFLRKYNLMSPYIVYVEYVNITQIVAIGFSFSGMIILLFKLSDPIYNQIMFALMVASSIYAMKQASAAVTIMHDLAWQQGAFDELPPADADKVVKIRKD